MKRLLASLLLLAACTDPEPTAPTRLQPGPCSSQREAPTAVDCVMTYDQDGALAAAHCNEGLRQGEWAWTFERDGDALVALQVHNVESTNGGATDLVITTDTWTFGRDATVQVRVIDNADAGTITTTESRYEPDLVLNRHPFELWALPSAEDALVASTTVRTRAGETLLVEEHTFRFDGPARPRGGTRVRTRDDGETETFSYDQSGRLATGFAYRGTLMVSSPRAQYVHDIYGNLTTRYTSTSTTTFDYGCWQ